MTLHTYLSYIKSVVRIVGYVLLLGDTVAFAVVLLIGAEVIGIIEELPGTYKGTDTNAGN